MNNLQIEEVLLRTCLTFFQFQPGVAYESVACIKICAASRYLASSK